MLKILFYLVILSVSITAQTFKIKDYYQLKEGNSWNYTAPITWKGDYISRMEAGEKIPFNEENNYQPTINHFDATNAAKILLFIKNKGIYYIGENFADNTKIRFDKPILWFTKNIKIGQETDVEMPLTRTLSDGKTVKGNYKLKQKIVSVEDVIVTAGKFKKCLKIESETFWDLGDGRKARSINTYHYAKNVGVVKASARFIIINKEGKETINRLIETDLKSAIVNGEKLKVNQKNSN
jgi:hypothetical protein